MALYGIGDLHLSNRVDKPMDIFGPQWTLHYEKIKENWLVKVKPEDAVLITGDTSWGMKMEDAMEDLEWINQLPGKKIIIKGNHDYWWGSISRLNSLFESIGFLQNNFFIYGGYAICGTRGWICPNDNKFTEQDEKVYLREVQRLKLSLEAARKAGYNDIIGMLHYPPTNEKLEPSLFTEVMEFYEVQQVVYGHLHGEEFFQYGLQGVHKGVLYRLVSCDYLDFDLLRLL